MADKLRKNSALGRITALADHREFMIFYIIVLGVIGLAYAKPEFLSKPSLAAVMLSLTAQSIIAIGMTILLVSGTFDLSVGSTFALAGTVTAIWLKSGLPAPLAIGLGLGVGVLIGLINGLIITEIGINAFITTLGMMGLVRGLMMVVSGGRNISELPASFNALGQGELVPGVQNPILILVVLIVISDFLLRRSRFFRQSYYIGGNEAAAMLSGINVRRIKVFNFALVGFLAALGGIIITARLGSASTTAGKGLELKVISAAIIGGASLKGGAGTILGALLGAGLMSIIVSSITLLGIDPNWVDFVIGAALLLAVMADVTGRKARPAAGQ
jgi:ribose transport system permease protein